MSVIFFSTSSILSSSITTAKKGGKREVSALGPSQRSLTFPVLPRVGGRERRGGGSRAHCAVKQLHPPPPLPGVSSLLSSEPPQHPLSSSLRPSSILRKGNRGRQSSRSCCSRGAHWPSSPRTRCTNLDRNVWSCDRRGSQSLWVSGPPGSPERSSAGQG